MQWSNGILSSPSLTPHTPRTLAISQAAEHEDEDEEEEKEDEVASEDDNFEGFDDMDAEPMTRRTESIEPRLSPTPKPSFLAWQSEEKVTDPLKTQPPPTQPDHLSPTYAKT